MSIQRLLIANRGEIAIRIAHGARTLGIPTVAIFASDDSASLHLKHMDDSVPLSGAGTAAYLNAAEIIEAAKTTGADAIHPGYGFLSENADFARLCEKEGITFVGPDVATLEALADKSAARSLAVELNVPVLAGTNEATTIEDACLFLAGLPKGNSIFLKAISGGGGRGMRLVHNVEELAAAYSGASLEAEAAFGDGRLYVEQFMPAARHIEVQIIGDGADVIHLHERDCSVQRRNQKVIEIAPAPNLPANVKAAICEAALLMAAHVKYKGLGTFEFLVSAKGDDFSFMEANPRIQVEHTITEEILGLDLVAAQLRIAGGQTLGQIGYNQSRMVPRGFALQARVNAETFSADGTVRPASGKITRHELPHGRGIRIDSTAHSGWQPNPRYDSLLTKIIVSDPEATFRTLLASADRALANYKLSGLETNIGFLRSILQTSKLQEGAFTTRFVDENITDILSDIPKVEPEDLDVEEVTGSTTIAPEGASVICSPLMGTVVEILVGPGDEVLVGQQVAVLEAMKMEHQITAPFSGVVLDIPVDIGQTIMEGSALLFMEKRDLDGSHDEQSETVDLDYIRPDLESLLYKQSLITDDARPEAVAKRHARGKQTIRENIDRLVDTGSLSEYGGFNIAAQRSRHSVETLERISPADGMVAGTASVNGDYFEESRSGCVVLGYDYMVFAGTQGVMNHKKTDRLLHLAEARQLPIIFYGEGGGGRPGDVDINAASTLDIPTFQTYARLSGLVPRIGIASGRCFAGNAALMGVSDILIATEDTTIGMGGPAMIEGGGLGVYTPEEVGPVSVQAPNGVIDIVAKDEMDATDLAKKALSYFQGTLRDWEEEDQRTLRSIIPENRLRVYDIRKVIHTLADKDTVLEMRPAFAPGMITAFMRLEGRPVGLIANNPMHLGGAIDADGSEKAARHIQLCDAFDIPILTLCDTPGFMVGPEAEKTALVRKTARLFAAAGSVTVPVFTVILRKGYGLGAQAMGAGSMHAPFLTLSWPTGEMGPMGIEGAVRLGYKKELAAIEDEEERNQTFNTMVDAAYIRGKAVNAAAYMEIDDVIDPAQTRTRLLQALKAVGGPTGKRIGKKRNFVDTW
ncbi:MAG: carboxyl transferase domain-containing protein [Sneathiella sp.]